MSREAHYHHGSQRIRPRRIRRHATIYRETRSGGVLRQLQGGYSPFGHDETDLVPMDIDLTGMSGLEGTNRIKKHCPDCIVLIITVHEDIDKVFQSLCAGASGYIVKNSNLDEVVRGIDESLAGAASMSLHIAGIVVKNIQAGGRLAP